MKIKVSDKAKALLRQSADADQNIAQAAHDQLMPTYAEVIREGIMAGDIVTNIYEEIPLEADAVPEFQLDLLAPGTEGDYTAYTISQHGYMPQKSVESDYVMVPTYAIGNAIDWPLRYARSARWDVVSRAIEVMQLGVTKKMNDDGWHLLLTAVVDRNLLVYDSDAAPGNFTKRLLTLAKTVMARNGGGNSSSVNHRQLTDAYTSLEAIDDMRNWGIDQLSDTSRREVETSSTGLLSRIFDVNLRPVYEFGVGQEYTNYFTGTLGGSLGSSDIELIVGLDLVNGRPFKMPTKMPWQMFRDPGLHRSQRDGYYGWRELGFCVLDNRNAIGLSF